MLAVHAAEPVAMSSLLVGSATSLAGQSRGDRTGQDHRDGWGLGWYEPTGARTQYGDAAACDDPQFATAAERLTARIALAHVRDASVGSVRIENCHPFVYGPWLFCHNGTIEGFDRLRPTFLRETLPELSASFRGDTDSEHLFRWLLSNAVREGLLSPQITNVSSAHRADADGLYRLVRESLRRVLGWCEAQDVPPPTGLNLFLTDGRLLIAVRHSRTLWWHPVEAGADISNATVVSSEPTDDRAPWRELPDPSILTIDSSGRAVVRPF
jgi:glutamine amidotransferase